MFKFAYLRRLAAIAALSAALATPGVVGLTSGAAYARPMTENTISGECKSSGGIYGSWFDNNIRWSTCTYRVVGGDRYRDFYADGEYYSTKRV